MSQQERVMHFSVCVTLVAHTFFIRNGDVIMRIIAFIIYIFVKIQVTKHEDISHKELKQLKVFSTIGILLFIPDVILFILTGGTMTSFILTGGIGIDVLLIILSIIICVLNISNLKALKLMPRKNAAIINNNIVEKNGPIIEKTQNKPNALNDLYALIISLVTFPTLLFIYLTNVTEKEITHTGAWATTSTVYSISDSIKCIIILLAVASVIGSMFLILHKGKNNSNKATWVKILNVINIIGSIIILSI